MTNKITRMKDKTHHLPVAHTCFNQVRIKGIKIEIKDCDLDLYHDPYYFYGDLCLRYRSLI